MKFAKLTEFSSADKYIDEEYKRVETNTPVFVSLDAIVLVKTSEYYTGGSPEYVVKTLIAFVGGENYIYVNETVDEVITMCESL